MDESAIFVLAPLVAVLLLFGPAIGGELIRRHKESKILTVNVPLFSKRVWNSYNPLLAFSTISDLERSAIRRLFEPRAKQHTVRIRWHYTTPSGRSHYEDEMLYPVNDELRALLSRGESIDRQSSDRIDSLESFYVESLRKGWEIADDLPKFYCYQVLGGGPKSGLVNVGYTTKNVQQRIERQLKEPNGAVPVYHILLVLSATDVEGNRLRLKSLHDLLEDHYVHGEWFNCKPQVVNAAVKELQYPPAKVEEIPEGPRIDFI